jgi:3-keto-L-gulonate-6-phosphate decarboxylase
LGQRSNNGRRESEDIIVWAFAWAQAAGTAGADLVEVGDPLIKRYGICAVPAIREAAPSAMVVAEMISTDWGRD